MQAIDKIKEVIGVFFINEPILFEVYCVHNLEINNKIHSIRTGNKKIEFNELYINNLSSESLLEVIKMELIRIVLLHPYQRKKRHSNIAYFASNITIVQLHKFNQQFLEFYGFIKNRDFPHRESLEYYYQLFTDKLNSSLSLFSFENINEAEITSNNNDDKEGSSFNNFNLAKKKRYTENSELWDEDDLSQKEIKEIVSECISAKKWGSITANIIYVINKSHTPKLNYKQIVKQFRANLIQSERILTRTKPNRRYGFDFLGSKNTYAANLLIAIDASGSASDHELNCANNVIKRFFNYGLKSIDYVVFDTEIKTLKSLKKNRGNIFIAGRGGTDFQCVFDFVNTHKKKKYDGLIIITDGDAPKPIINKWSKHKTLWMINSKSNYDRNNARLNNLGKLIWIED